MQIILRPDDCSIESIAASDTKPRILGDKILKDWKPDDDSLVGADVSDAKGWKWDAIDSDVNGKLVPRLRGQQMKEQAQLDGWLRDGSAAYIESLGQW